MLDHVHVLVTCPMPTDSETRLEPDVDSILESRETNARDEQRPDALVAQTRSSRIAFGCASIYWMSAAVPSGFSSMVVPEALHLPFVCA